MKKLAAVLVLFLVITSELKAQKQVLFKLKYLPATNYSSVIKMDMNMDMNMTGDSSFLDQVKKSGQKFPMQMNMQMGFNVNTVTKNANSKMEIPFKMNIESTPSKVIVNGAGNNVPTPAGNQVYYGVYTNDMKIRIDSMPGKAMDENLKQSVIKMLEGIQASIKFPEKPMKIGDTFSQDVPMDIPMAGMSAKAICKTTYKLISIESNKANFDLNYVIQMDMSGKMSMNMTGDGNGKFVYDITKNYPVSMVNNMNISYDMNMPQAEKVKMNGKAKIIMTNQTSISAIK